MSGADKREPSKPDGTAVASLDCCCGLCAISRKSDAARVCAFASPRIPNSIAYLIPKEASCDHERESGPTAVSFHDMTRHKSEESYPDVPRTASSLSLATTPPIYLNESSLEVATSGSVHIFTDNQYPSAFELSTSNSQREFAGHPISLSNRSPSPRIFVQSASTQSNLSLATSTDAAFLAPRPAPVPPAIPGGAPNMSLTFVPFFRRVEEREMIACQICLDEELVDDSAIIQTCGHAFGRECMRQYILSRLDERRFPIPCPCCSAADDAGSNPGRKQMCSPLNHS